MVKRDANTHRYMVAPCKDLRAVDAMRGEDATAGSFAAPDRHGTATARDESWIQNGLSDIMPICRSYAHPAETTIARGRCIATSVRRCSCLPPSPAPVLPQKPRPPRRSRRPLLDAGPQ